MKIAIVDDEILVRVGIRSIIEWEKHDCCIIWEAGSGAEALEKYEADARICCFWISLCRESAE